MELDIKGIKCKLEDLFLKLRAEPFLNCYSYFYKNDREKSFTNYSFKKVDL